MTLRNFQIFGIALFVMLLASCSSTKMLKKTHFIDGMSEVEYVEKLINHVGEWGAFTAKVNLSVDLDGKSVTKVGGTLRIKKGEVIQLSVAPLLGIEVARAEISPNGILVIDRVNKRYVRASFSELESLVHADLDFHSLQALFLHELFLPGNSRMTVRDASNFRVDVKTQEVVLEAKKGGRFTYQFLTQAPEAVLKESCIALAGTPYLLRWKYDAFRPFEQEQFPTDMQIIFEGAEKPVKAAMALSRLSTNSNWETHTEVSARYMKVELADILKLLIK